MDGELNEGTGAGRKPIGFHRVATGADLVILEADSRGLEVDGTRSG